MFKKSVLAAVFATGLAANLVGSATAADKFILDPGHSQIVFSYVHLGYTTSFGMFSGFTGEAMLDTENPANSSVSVSMKVLDMITGFEKRKAHFMSADFFNANDSSIVTFNSTSIDMTGKDTAKITGDLTLNGVTKPVVLDAKLNKLGEHPRSGKKHAGFSAKTRLLRSDYNLGKFAPNISDEVDLQIMVEMSKEG